MNKRKVDMGVKELKVKLQDLKGLAHWVSPIINSRHLSKKKF